VTDTWLITGGCGFIGKRLVSTLRDNTSACLRVFDNLSVGSKADLEAGVLVEQTESSHRLPVPSDGAVQLIQGDICDVDAITNAMQGVDNVVHLAANTGVAPSVVDPQADCHINVVGTLNVLEAARHAGVRRFIFASSGAPIGEANPPIHEELAAHPVSPYGASKLAGEGYCSAYARTYNLDTVALRFGNVYGPGSSNKSSVVAKFIRDAMTEGLIRIYGDGLQTRDFVYIDDLIQAICAAETVPNIGGEIFQIATQSETTVQEIAGIICKKLPILGVPAPKIIYEKLRVGDVLRNFSDTGKARKILGWQSKVGTNEGIEATIKWFLDNETSLTKTTIA